jgi:WD40 repeat protein
MDIEGAGINVVVALAERARCGLTTSSDHTICVWDLETENWIRRLEGHNASVYALAATPDRTKALSGSQDGTIRIWDLGRLDHLLTLKSTRRERSWEP